MPNRIMPDWMYENAPQTVIPELNAELEKAYFGRGASYPYMPADPMDPNQMKLMGDLAQQQPSAHDLTGVADLQDAIRLGQYTYEHGPAATLEEAKKLIPESLTPALETIPYAAPVAAAAIPLVGMMNRGVPSNMPRMVRKQAGVLGGPMAADVDTGAMNRAKLLKEQGVSDDAIWRETGWELSDAGHWRFEIPDNAVRVNPEIGPGEYIANVGDVIDHPQLFANYPHLKDEVIRFTVDPKITDDTAIGGRSGDKLSVFRDPTTGKAETIRMEVTARNPEDLRRVLLHEVQHRVQNFEKTPGGGSKREVGKWMDGQRRQYDKALSDLREIETIHGKDPDIMDASTKVRYEYLQNKVRGLVDRNPVLTLDEFYSEGLTDYDYYANLAGEIESRAVEARSKMTPEELAKTPPTYTEALDDFRFDPESSIIRYNPAFAEQTVYHASPHKFQEFDLGKIGTGEGAQVRGWGLYFADKKGVANWYYDNFKRDLPKKVLDPGDLQRYQFLLGRYEPKNLDSRASLQNISDRVTHAKTRGYKLTEALRTVHREDQWLFREMWEKEKSPIDYVIDEIEDLAQAAAERGDGLQARILEEQHEFLSGAKEKLDKPALYKVELQPDEKSYLVLDDQLVDQPEPVQKALNEIGISTKVDEKTDPIKILGGEPEIKPASDYIGDGDTFEYLAEMLEWPKSDPWDAADIAEAWGFGPDDEIIRFPGGLNAVRFEDNPRHYMFLNEDATDYTGSWDEFLDAAAEMAIDYGAVDDMAVNLGTGESIYQMLTEKLGSPKAASKFLNKHGIPGLKFRDASSRGGGRDKTYNYVLFDDSKAMITERDGAPIPNQPLVDLGKRMQAAVEAGDIEAVMKLKAEFDSLIQK